MIPWPPHRDPRPGDTDFVLTSSASSADEPLFVSAKNTSSTGFDPELAEFEAKAAEARAEEERRRDAQARRARKRARKDFRERRGKGHDPRRQVIARTRSHGRGRGRR